MFQPLIVVMASVLFKGGAEYGCCVLIVCRVGDVKRGVAVRYAGLTEGRRCGGE